MYRVWRIDQQTELVFIETDGTNTKWKLTEHNYEFFLYFWANGHWRLCWEIPKYFKFANFWIPSPKVSLKLINGLSGIANIKAEDIINYLDRYGEKYQDYRELRRLGRGKSLTLTDPIEALSSLIEYLELNKDKILILIKTQNG